MRLISLVVISFFLSGCSWLFHDHANDYLEAESTPAIKLPPEYEKPSHSSTMMIPTVKAPFIAQEEFVVPRPEKLLIEEEEQSTSLTKIQSTEIEPQLVKDGNGTPILRMGVGFPRAWAALGEALKLSDIEVTDLNRSIGTYYIETLEEPEEEAGSWSWLVGEPEPELKILEVKLNRARSGVYVAIHEDADTLASDSKANELLIQIAKNLK